MFSECHKNDSFGGLCVKTPQQVWPLIKIVGTAAILKGLLTVATFGVRVPAGIFIRQSDFPYDRVLFKQSELIVGNLSASYSRGRSCFRSYLRTRRRTPPRQLSSLANLRDVSSNSRRWSWTFTFRSSLCFTRCRAFKLLSQFCLSAQLNTSDLTQWAMIGAAATLAGVTRTTVSLAVIVFELTGSSCVLLFQSPLHRGD